MFINFTLMLAEISKAGDSKPAFFANTNYLLIISLIVGGFVLGFIFERIVLAWVKKVAVDKESETVKIVVKSFSWIGTIWLGLLGIFFAARSLQVTSASGASIINVSIIVVKVLLIVSVTWLMMRLAVGFIRYSIRKVEKEEKTSSMLVNLTRVIILILGGLIIMNTFGFSITPIITALGVAGFAVALALQETLANLFAGLQILISKQFTVGDYVKLSSGEEGKVADISWRNTTVEALSNNMIVIPNSKIASSAITIYNQPNDELSVSIAVGIDYKSDLAKVEEIVIDETKMLIEESDGAIKNCEPFVRFKEFGDSSINLKVYLRAKDFVSQFKLKHDLMKRIYERFQKEGINIPFPITTVHLQKEE